MNESARKTLRTAARDEKRPVMMLMMLMAAFDAMATGEEDEKHAEKQIRFLKPRTDGEHSDCGCRDRENFITNLRAC